MTEKAYTVEQIKEMTDPKNVTLGSGTISLSCSKLKARAAFGISVLLTVPFCVDMIGLSFFEKWNPARLALDLLLLAASALFTAFLRCDRYSWRTTGRELTITRKNKPAIVIFYNRVSEITYRHSRFGGLTVTVRTFDGDRDFVLAHTKKFENTPFYIAELVVNYLKCGHSVEDFLWDRINRRQYNMSVEEAFRVIVAEERAKEEENRRARASFFDIT